MYICLSTIFAATLYAVYTGGREYISSMRSPTDKEKKIHTCYYYAMLGHYYADLLGAGDVSDGSDEEPDEESDGEEESEEPEEHENPEEESEEPDGPDDEEHENPDEPSVKEPDGPDEPSEEPDGLAPSDDYTTVT